VFSEVGAQEHKPPRLIRFAATVTQDGRPKGIEQRGRRIHAGGVMTRVTDMKRKLDSAQAIDTLRRQCLQAPTIRQTWERTGLIFVLPDDDHQRLGAGLVSRTHIVAFP
jgi:hypothetical protein